MAVIAVIERVPITVYEGPRQRISFDLGAKDNAVVASREIVRNMMKIVSDGLDSMRDQSEA